MTPANRPRLSTSVVASAAGLGEPALGLLKRGIKPRKYLLQLVEAGHQSDAIKFLAQSLPPREGVWWAWVNARHADGGDKPPVLESLAATERWIAQPTHEHAHASYARADAADAGTPAGMAGLAAFLSGPSMAPPGQQLIPPPAGTAQRLIAGAVSLAVLGGDPATVGARFYAAMEQGMDVVNKIGLWPE